MLFEGIVIHKVPYKERDLIVKLLLRNGLLGSFYVYGGQGGGKHHKPSIFEVGSMVKILVKEQKAKAESELMIAAESSRLWEPHDIRHDVRAFYLICLYFELVQKFGMNFQPGTSEYSNQDQEGIFSVVSNAIFYIQDSLTKKTFEPHQQLTLFMVKLLFHLGIMPDTDNCSYCHSALMEDSAVVFMPAQGQFACYNCQQGENEKGFLLRIKKSYQTKFQDYTDLHGTGFPECDKLLQYFCHQYHLRPVELKSYALLFR